MPSDLVLITGATGHIGFKVLVDALEAGYNVRAAIRDISKANIILSTKSITDLSPGPRLTFVEVPEITADGAYDHAVQGVKYIIHVASPLADLSMDPANAEAEIVTPAVNGTVGMLRSAKKAGGIERVVITGSNASIVPTSTILGGSDDLYDETSKAEVSPMPVDNVYVAYCSSKVAAYQATQEFIEKEKPSFDVITLMPSFVIGANELVTDPKHIMDGSNGFAFGQVLGVSLPFTGAGSSVHLEDVAKIHVLSLDPEIPGNTNYILNSGGLRGTMWSDVNEIVARRYPQAVAAGVLPNNGILATHRLQIDAGKVEKTFGIKLLGLEEQIVSLTDHYLKLVGAEAK